MLILSIKLNAQIDFVGCSRLSIIEHFSNNPSYQTKADSLTKGTILLTFKQNDRQYPFYTYEVDTKKDKCTSFGLVSKNREVLEAYLDVLDRAGLVVQKDSAMKTVVYRIGLGNESRYYSINRPYLKDKNRNKRELFYILISIAPNF